MKMTEYKVVGVTFDGADGPRQKILKGLYDTAVREEIEDYSITLERYEYENSPAARVLFNGYDVGNIGKENVEEALSLYEQSALVSAEIRNRNKSVDDYLSLLDDWKNRKRDLKDGYIDEDDIDDMHDELDALKEIPLYSAVVEIYVKGPEDDRPAPEPEPEQKKRGLFGRLRRK